MTTSVDSCAGDKERPFSGVISSGRVWRKVPESGGGSVPQSYLLHEELGGEETETDGLQQTCHVTPAAFRVEVDPATHGVKHQLFVADVEVVRLQHFAHLVIVWR